MNLTDLARVLLRWRWILVPVVVLSLAAGAAGYLVTPPTYTQTERYLLLSPVVTEQGAGNPFLQLGNGVSMAAGVLMTKVAAGEIAAEVLEGVPGLAFTIAGDPTTSAPIVVVTAEGAEAADVAGALDRVGEQLVAQLALLQQQSGAPEVSWVTISQLTRDLAATPVGSGRLRSAVVGLVAVLAVGLALVLLLERRRRSRAGRVTTGQAAADEPIDASQPDPATGRSEVPPLPSRTAPRDQRTSKPRTPARSKSRTSASTATASPNGTGWPAAGDQETGTARLLTGVRSGSAGSDGSAVGADLLGSSRVS